MILVSSEGPSAVIWASLFGLYQEAGTHGGVPCYAQLHDTSPAPPSWLYRAQDTGCWVVGPQLGAVDCALANKDIISDGKVPVTGWLYSGETDWCKDPALSVTSTQDEDQRCGVVSVRSGSKHLGLFKPTAQFSAGRRVFRSRAGKFLLVTSDSERWVVAEDSKGGRVVTTLTMATHMCPEYKPTKGSEVVMYCNIHSKYKT